MSNASDIEELLFKATKHAKRVGMVKTAVVALGAFAGSAFGVGVASGKYLAKILEGQDGILHLVQGQDEKIKDLQSANRFYSDRLAKLDPSVDISIKCCTEQTRRTDFLMQRAMERR